MERTQPQKKVMRASMFWRMSQAAMRSGRWETYWNLTPQEQAWIIATLETQDLIQAVVDYVAELEDDSD